MDQLHPMGLLHQLDLEVRRLLPDLLRQLRPLNL
jgi:hypothetical protein